MTAMEIAAYFFVGYIVFLVIVLSAGNYLKIRDAKLSQSIKEGK